MDNLDSQWFSDQMDDNERQQMSQLYLEQAPLSSSENPNESVEMRVENVTPERLEEIVAITRSLLKTIFPGEKITDEMIDEAKKQFGSKIVLNHNLKLAIRVSGDGTLHNPHSPVVGKSFSPMVNMLSAYAIEKSQQLYISVPDNHKLFDGSSIRRGNKIQMIDTNGSVKDVNTFDSN